MNIQDAINILQQYDKTENPKEVLRQAAQIVFQNNIGPKDILLAIEIYDSNPDDAQQYIYKAIKDLEGFMYDQMAEEEQGISTKEKGLAVGQLLSNVANSLDKKGFIKEADAVDQMIESQPIPQPTIQKVELNEDLLTKNIGKWVIEESGSVVGFFASQGDADAFINRWIVNMAWSEADVKNKVDVWQLIDPKLILSSYKNKPIDWYTAG